MIMIEMLYKQSIINIRIIFQGYYYSMISSMTATITWCYCDIIEGFKIQYYKKPEGNIIVTFSSLW